MATQYRIKTEAEFRAEHEVDYQGFFSCAKGAFNPYGMSHLYGHILTEEDASKILNTWTDGEHKVRFSLSNGPEGRDNLWVFRPEMITLVKDGEITATETQTISRANLESIHKVACSTWKRKIESYVTRAGVFSDSIALTQEEVNEMFEACTKDQIKVLLKAGLKRGAQNFTLRDSELKFDGKTYYNPCTTNHSSNHLISMRVSDNKKYDTKSFYLSEDFEWSIETDNNSQVLVFKPKKVES